MIMSSKVQLKIESQFAMITLNRPEKLNALDPEMLSTLEQITGQVDQNRSVRVVIITGAGDRGFCVGADINAWAALSPIQMWSEWIRNGHRVFDRLAHLRQPVICALNGYTFGGGLELALTADIRLAAEHIELAMPEVKLGTVPGWAGTSRLPGLIGPARAKRMIFTGDRISADTAERWGLVNEIVPRNELIPRAEALATAIAANSPTAVQIAKQLINAGGGDGLTVVMESLGGAAAAGTEDGREGLAAFREKRSPKFTGN
jgi:enoyl-CoA hydratase